MRIEYIYSIDSNINVQGFSSSPIPNKDIINRILEENSIGNKIDEIVRISDISNTPLNLDKDYINVGRLGIEAVIKDNYGNMFLLQKYGNKLKFNTINTIEYTYYLYTKK